MRKTLFGGTVLALAAALPLHAQVDIRKETQRWQQMIAEGSPAELFEIEGEDLWKKKQGPKNVSLEACDLGQGPGVVKAAYARLPKYFADADRVMDLETRLLHCMTTLQGRTHEDATRRLYGNADRPSEMELLSIYIAGQSRGVPMAPGTRHAKEREAFDLGQKLFFHRAGAWDFSCSSCHGEADKRIRLQYLPVMSQPEGARKIVATWPTYLVRNAQVKTMQWRIWDCYRQMRWPEPVFGSEATVAITQYLTVTGQGEPYAGPGTKR